MKKIFSLGAGVLALALSQASFAATGSWTLSNNAPSVYAEGAENSTIFQTPSTVPSGSTVTTISWNIGLYTNGATKQQYKICYAPQYSSTYSKCLDVSTTLTGSSNYFTGLNAKGQFKITGVLTGGTYPVYPTHKNSLTVNYQY